MQNVEQHKLNISKIGSCGTSNVVLTRDEAINLLKALKGVEKCLQVKLQT
jgi:hypothetical protein